MTAASWRAALAAGALGALLLSAPAIAAPPEAGEPELIDAWLLLGEHERALREAQALASAADADWRDHSAYVRAATTSHLRWAVVDEYRWLASQEPLQPEMILLSAWAATLQARGPALDQALLVLEDAARGQGPAGLQLLAEALLRAGAYERAAELLLGARTPGAQGLRVQALVGAGEYRQAAQLAIGAIEARPRHPEVAAALWDRGVPSGPVRKARRLAVGAAEALLDQEDPVLLLAAWQILARDRRTEAAQRAADGIAAAVPGLVLPARLPYGTLMLEHLGEGLARTGQEAPPAELTPAEQAAVAAIRARTLRDDGLVDQARRAYRDAITLNGGDPELLLEAAALHLEVEPQQALEWVGQALLMLACEAGLEPGQRRQAIARGLELQARSLRSLEQHDQALGYQLIASLLQPSPGGLVELAALQEQQGGPEAALESLALAAALGSSEARGEMERLYRGPASVDALVAAVSTDLQRWTSGDVVPEPPRLSPLAGRVLSTSAGDLSIEALEGQVVVLVFWASWCAPCAQELPLVADLQGSWREEGLPVRVLAVSVDQAEADYRRGARRYEALDIALCWEPSLARELGIEAVPATRLLDPAGLPAGRLQGFADGHAERLDGMVRSLLEP
jgi:thiol-disulfide isomerase/thioredoxin